VGYPDQRTGRRIKPLPAPCGIKIAGAGKYNGTRVSKPFLSLAEWFAS